LGLVRLFFGRKPGRYAQQRVQRGRGTFGHVLERPGGGGDVGEGRVAPLDTEASEPSQRRALEAVWLGIPDRHADRQGVAEADVRQLGGRGADDAEVGHLERALEAAIGRPLARHERRFA
jgi:hypothetical protein